MKQSEMSSHESEEEPIQTHLNATIEDDVDTKAEKGLRERPKLSIRARLTLGFVLFFFLSGAGISIAWYTAYSLEKRFHFLELADQYTFEIQQARRFEKNYFLYATNLMDVLNHVERAQHLLISATDELRSVIGKENFKTMEKHLNTYDALITQLIEHRRNQSSGAISPSQKIETELRKHGAEMVSVALHFANKERKAVDNTFKQFKSLPIVFLVLLLLLAIYTANFLTRQMLGPLGRLTKTTQRIAEGDFSPHRAHRRFKDEFSDFTIAINRMARELQHRQKILVESQKLKSLGTLTAGVAHEINNPLNNISTSFQILSEEISDRLSEYHRGLLASVESQIIKARDIVRALLEFSRESDFVLKPADIREVVDDTLKLIKGDIPSHIRVRVNIPERIEIEVGKARLQQALLNLITNGIDAMQEEDDGLLTIQGSADRGDQVFRLEIADTGIGIPPEHIPQIFDPFFTTKEVGHGTGMGLSVTYRIIKRHGGNMSVESELGKGTKFIILLPLSRNREAGYGEENSHPHR